MSFSTFNNHIYNNKYCYIYVFISLIIIGILIVSLVNCTNKTCSPYKNTSINCNNCLYNGEYKEGDSVCMCVGNNKICSNRQALINSYNDGSNTEFQEFKKNNV